MCPRIREALITALIMTMLLVLAIAMFANQDKQDLWYFTSIYIAVSIATGDWSTGRNCGIKFWQKKEQNKQ
jgi:hypothetical protein